jgi:hypothetical protein
MVLAIYPDKWRVSHPPTKFTLSYVEHDNDRSEEDTLVLQFFNSSSLTNVSSPTRRKSLIHSLQMGSPMNAKLKQLAVCLVVGR